MAKKIIIESFKGESPRTPDVSLAENFSSHTVNTRLSNGFIRGLPRMEESTDNSSELSALIEGQPVGDGYTNFFKASSDDTLFWMSWSTPGVISVLETRYNDLEAYPAPQPPTDDVAPAGSEFNVTFSGQGVQYTYQGEWVASGSKRFESNDNPNQVVKVTTTVTAVVSDNANPVSTYLWEKQSEIGDAVMSIDDPNIQSPTFDANLPAPVDVGEEGGSSVEAVWKCTVTDTSANTSEKEIKVMLWYFWINLDFGGGGGTVDSQVPDYPLEL